MTVHIHHLRLHPDTEIQPERLDLSSESRETSRKLLLVDFPVSQGMCVIIALAEPAVVHHKKFYAGFLCLLRQSKQLSLIDVKIGCLPAVKQHRTHLVLKRSTHDVLPHKCMHALAHAIVALAGIRHDRLRRRKVLPRSQQPGK